MGEGKCLGGRWGNERGHDNEKGRRKAIKGKQRRRGLFWRNDRDNGKNNDWEIEEEIKGREGRKERIGGMIGLETGGKGGKVGREGEGRS